MLRAFVVLLAAANLLLFAWTQGYLPATTPQPPTAAASRSGAALTPIEPQAIVLLDAETFAALQATPPLAAAEPQQAQEAPAPASEVAAVAAPATPPADAAQAQGDVNAPAQPVCRVAGPFTDAQLEPLRAALADLAPALWRSMQTSQSGRWMVFWGGVDDELLINARLAELQAADIAHERLRNHPAGPGFSLGRFSTEAGAEQQQRALAQRGINGTAIVIERAPAVLTTIEFPDYAAVQAQLGNRLLPLLGDQALRPC